VTHIPVPLLRLARFLMRPVRPDIADMIEASITFDTAAMSFDAAELRSRFPQVELHGILDVVRQRSAASSCDKVAPA